VEKEGNLLIFSELKMEKILFNLAIIGDGTCVSLYDPKTKQQSCQKCDSLGPKKSKSKVGTLSIFCTFTSHLRKCSCRICSQGPNYEPDSLISGRGTSQKMASHISS